MTKSISRPKRTPAKPGRVSLLPNEFETLIEDQGVKVRITPTLLCPNITDINSYNHDLNCQVCDNGIADLDSKSTETWAFIQSITHDKEFSQDGIWDFRDARITFQASMDLRINYWYRVEVLDFTMPYNELIIKRNGTEDITRYYPQADASKTKFYLIDKTGAEYEFGVDFEVYNKGIKWIGNSPTNGDMYSISYPILPTFRILDLMHDNRYYYDDFKRNDKVPLHLPQQAHVRFDFLAKNKGYEEANPEPPVPGSVPPPPFKTGFNA